MLNIALLQLLSCETQAENIQKGIEFCIRARALGADIALFPEMWNVGYNLPNDPASWNELAVGADSDFVMTFRVLARELDMAIAITYLERYSPAPRNTVSLIDRTGNIVLTYAKVHTCDFDIERHLTPGDGFPVVELDTAAGKVKVGAMICYDREFPESARILMLNGAEIILVPNACPMEINRLSQLRSRAFENMVGVATANYAAGQPDCNGHSSAFDGIAYVEYYPGEYKAHDMLVAEAEGAEDIYLARFPLALMRDYRATEVHGNTYRHPKKYSAITAERINEPFKRGDYRP